MSEESDKYVRLKQVIVNLDMLKGIKYVISVNIEPDGVIIKGLTEEEIRVTYEAGFEEAERKGLLILKKG